MLTEDKLDALALERCKDEFDLDVKVIPNRKDPRNWFGEPDWSEAGSTCQFSCPHTCGGQCTFQVADPECSAK